MKNRTKLSTKTELIFRFPIFMVPVFIILTVIFGGAPFSYAQDFETQKTMRRIEIPSSPNPVGSGARALGMGGAFISIADDATAASWNPAGLSILDRPEASLVGSLFHRMEENSFGLHPEADGEETVTDTNLNYFSLAWPFRLWDRHMTVSLSYQHLYEFTRKWNFPLIESETNEDGSTDSYSQNLDYQTEGSLTALGLACCIQITPRFSFGLTMNIWDDDLTENSWESKQFQWGGGWFGANRFTEDIRIYDNYSFSGINFNFGFLWRDVADMPLQIGMVLKTPFAADLEHKHSVYSFTQYPDLPSRADIEHSESYEREESLDMPMSAGIGFAYRFSDIWTVSLDMYWTKWDDFILTDSSGNEISPITGKSSGESDIDPTYQIRAGAEYLVYQTDTYLFPLTFGFFYDPIPAQGSPADVFGFSIGTGIAHKKYYSFDLAYQYRFGDDTAGFMLEAMNFSQDLREHTLYSSFVLYF